MDLNWRNNCKLVPLCYTQLRNKNVRLCIQISSIVKIIFGEYKKKQAATSRNVPSDMCAQKIQIRLRECAVWSESSLGAFWITKGYKISSCGQWRLWSDYVVAQADLSLRWAHISDGTFSHVAVQQIQKENHRQSNNIATTC